MGCAIKETRNRVPSSPPTFPCVSHVHGARHATSGKACQVFDLFSVAMISSRFVDELKKRLGSGAFAQVRLAEDLTTKKEYAMKILQKPANEFEKQTRPHWEDEVELSEKVDSEFVVKLFECYETDEDVYIVMEYCEMGSLADVIAVRRHEERPFNEEVPILFLILLTIFSFIHSLFTAGRLDIHLRFDTWTGGTSQCQYHSSRLQTVEYFLHQRAAAENWLVFLCRGPIFFVWLLYPSLGDLGISKQKADTLAYLTKRAGTPFVRFSIDFLNAPSPRPIGNT
jgi:hypothetical protein